MPICVRKIKKMKGQTLVEFAIIMPIFCLLIMSVFKMISTGLGFMVARHDTQLSSRAEFYRQGEKIRGEFVAMPPGGLTNDVLRGGDTPSPYCRDGEGYLLCGYR